MTPSLTPDLAAAKYHAVQALSAGGVHTFDSLCPRKFWRASPWNPDLVLDNAPHFDIGTAAHLAVLEPHMLAERVIVHDFDDYRTNAAKAIRAEAYATGKTPLKQVEYRQILDIGNLILTDPAAGPLFTEGMAEASLQWDWNGIPCKARPDYLATDYSYVLDLKTCASADAESVKRAAANHGWHVRASWYLGGVEAVTGVRPKRYIFVLIEKDPADCVTLYELSEHALHRGDQIIAKVLPAFGKCLADNRWPGYPGGVIDLPTWQEYRLAEREEEGEFR
jgi:PDDEXK-like domain of unknown function (DUF3799)